MVQQLEQREDVTRLKAVEDSVFRMFGQRIPYAVIIGSVAIRHGVLLTLQQINKVYLPAFHEQNPDAIPPPTTAECKTFATKSPSSG